MEKQGDDIAAKCLFIPGFLGMGSFFDGK